MKRWDPWFQKVVKKGLAGWMILALWGWGILAAQAEQRPSKTWKACEEMSEAEKAALQMDCRWSGQTPRHAQRSYAPAEQFPFNPPYTAEEVLYLADITTPNYRWDTDLIVNGKTLNTRGSLYENQGSAFFHYTTDEKSYWDRTMKLKGGEILQYIRAKYNLPPSNYGFGFVEVQYKMIPGEGTKSSDRWLYLPSLKKVRRIPAPRREDVVPQYDFTFDDSVGRPPWEYDHRIIGTDIIYPDQYYRFPPQDKTWVIPNTWKVVKVPFRDMPVMGLPDPSPLGLPKYTYPDTRPDGGVLCYVIESKPKPEMLPGYYCGRLIQWVSVKDNLLLRVEEYDPKEDKLFFIFEFRHLNLQPARGKMGITRFYTHYWDIRIDHMSDAAYIYFPPPNPPRDMKKALDPQRLLKVDEYDHPLNSFDITLKDPHLFPLRPALWPDKFPAQRGKRAMGNITPPIAERIARQDKAGRLVFDGER